MIKKIAVACLLLSMVGCFALIQYNGEQEKYRVNLKVQSVEYSYGGWGTGPMTILHLEGGGTYLLDGYRSVPSGDVQVVVTNAGKHKVARQQ